MFEDLTFLQALTVLLIGLLFFREDIIPWLKSWFGVKPEAVPTTPVTLADLLGQMTKLTEYFNHDTTQHNLEIKECLKSIDENMKTLVRKHDEYERFGIKSRCDHRDK